MATVLAVDDDAHARELLAAVLGYSGHQVRQATDGLEALRLAEADAPDLIIVDLLMPTMDGFEFVRRLRQVPHLSTTPVIFYSATYLECEARSLANACGVADIIAKPAEPQTILDVVSRNLGLPPRTAVSPPPEDFREQHLSLLLAKLSQRAEQVMPRLDAIIELGLQLASERDPQRVLHDFCGAARHIIGTKYAVIEIIDFGQNTIRCEATSGMLFTPACTPDPGLPLEPFHWKRKPRRLNELCRQSPGSSLPAWHPAVESLLSVPISSPDHVYGWLTLSDKLGSPSFSDEDEGLAQILAAQLGRIYENGLLYKDLTGSLARLETEVAERKRAEERIKLQATALETAANSILITDRRGTIVWVNPAFTALTGYAAAEVIGQNPRVLKSGQHNQSFYRHLWGTILAGNTWRGEFTNRRKDGAFYEDYHTITPVRSKDGQITHFVTIMEDISERKRAEAKIRELNEALEQRVRHRTAELEAVNRELEAFSYSVSHDLRAPLRSIGGFARLVRTDHAAQLDAEGSRMLDLVCRETQRMGQLIDDLLRFSRASRTQLEIAPIEMAALIRDAFDALTAQMSVKPRFDVKDLPLARGDAAMLRQVMVNLLANAIKFSSHRPQPVIEVSGWEETEFNGYSIKDNGAGFDPKYSHKLFGVFQRLHSDEEFEGTGVGLALVERIIHRHGGKVWGEGKPDQGATFSFTLPRAR